MYKKKIGVYRNRRAAKKWNPYTVKSTLTNIVYLGHLEQYKTRMLILNQENMNVQVRKKEL